MRHGVADATMTIGDGYGAAATNADVKSPFRAGVKVLSVAIMVLLVIGALGPAIESVTITVKVTAPLWVGVPDNIPALDNAIPFGRAPLTTDHV